MTTVSQQAFPIVPQTPKIPPKGILKHVSRTVPELDTNPQKEWLPQVDIIPQVEIVPQVETVSRNYRFAFEGTIQGRGLN